MNYDDAIKLLLEVLKTGDFHFHPKFIEELYDLLKTTLKGHERDFFNRLIKLLSQLGTLGREIINIDGHERLAHTGAGEWYSLHIQTKYINARLLITFRGNDPVFLICFNEKAGKRVSGYDKYIPLLSSRLAETEIEHE